MSNQRFIKFVQSSESDWLLENHPNAFLLLSLIAKRARRTPGHLDGLHVGECHIGDYQSCGLTEQKYRTAKTLLCELKIIEIIDTCRNRKKSTTGATTIGTKVRLIDTRIYDINIQDDNDLSNDRATTEQRPSNDEQERTRKKKKVKKEQPPMGGGVVEEKISFREFVSLTAEEHQKLIAEHGEEKTTRILDKLNSYKGSSGKTYKSDYMAIHSWVVDRINQDEKNGTTKKSTHDAGQNEPAEPKFRSNKVFTFGG